MHVEGAGSGGWGKGGHETSEKGGGGGGGGAAFTCSSVLMLVHTVCSDKIKPLANMQDQITPQALARWC